MPRVLTLLAVLLAASTAACSSAAAGPTTASTGEPISVVASTNVYADVVRTIGGDAVAVTAIIDDPEKDPHEYQGDAQTQLALSKARLVVENGGGYDDFVDTMLAAAPRQPTVLDVCDLSGYDQQPASGEFNEHVWYDLPTMATLATRLSTELGALDPDRAATFTANAATFTDRLAELEKSEAALKADHQGEGVAITEPVPLYLLEAAGLRNLTPEKFSEAVESDTDVAPAVLQQTVALFDAHQVKLLAYNEQTTGPQTEAVLAAAQRNGVATVPVTETLPAGTDYLSWMQSTIQAVAGALDA